MSTHEEELSRLSASTAVSIGELDLQQQAVEEEPPASPKPRVFRFALHTDDDGVVKGQFDSRFPGGCSFPLRKDVNLLVYPVVNEDKHSIIVKGEARIPMEWSYVIQMRIRTGHANSRLMSVVDADVFELGNREDPIVIDINDPMVEKLRFDVRFIRQMNDPLPVYDFGNVELCFKDGLPNLCVHKELLALHSDYMAEKLKNVEDGSIVEMGNSPRHCFLEVLHQIYRIQRPIWADFRALCQGSLAYQVHTITEVLVQHLVNYERFTLEQKLIEAARLQLIDAIGELAFRAEQNGNWSYLVGKGFDAAEELGEPIYHMVVCPAIVKAKYSRIGETYKKSAIPDFNLRNPSPAEHRLASPIVIGGKSLWVNRGILALCGTERFGRGNNGELYPLVTGALQEALNLAKVTLYEALEALFLYLYPGQKTIQIEFVRPLIIFLHTHQMTRFKEELELMLADEPPFTPQMLLDHLMYAENYGLENLRRMCLLRVEGSCQAIAAQMVNLPEFQEVLSARTRQMVLDRHCSGWALSWTKLWSKVPTKRLVRGVTNEVGGPKPCELENALHTFRCGGSDVAFGGRSAILGTGQ
uniref:BTB domain-containing protein n=1 Tax=Steinernema glaseri TaxID=37863 RepID=A0A1I7Y1U7_9BILA